MTPGADNEPARGRLLARLTRLGEFGDLIRGAGINMAIRVMGAGIAYLSQILLARWMGSFELGIYIYAWVWTNMLAMLATLGFNSSVVRFVPEYVAKQEFRNARGVIRCSILVVSLASTLIAVIGAIGVLIVRDSVAAYYFIPLLIAMAGVPLFALLNLYSNLGRAFERFVFAIAPLVVVRPLLLIVAVGALIAFGSATSGTTVIAIAVASCVLVLLWQAVNFTQRTPATVRDVSPVYHLRFWLRVSIPLFLYNSFYLILYSTDVIMLGFYEKPDQVAIYNAALRTATLINFIYLAVSAVAAPRFAALFAQDKKDELQATFTGIAKWCFWGSLLAAVGLLAAGNLILSFFGPGFTAGMTALAVLVLGNWVHTAVGPFGDVLTMTGHQNASAVGLGLVAVLNIALNAILIPIFGINGAAIATAASMITLTAILMILAKRRVGIALFRFARTG